MNEKPVISVILPALNVSKYIKQCLGSAEAQSLSNIEIICVDAGSTDGTLEIMNAEAAHDSRIRVIHSDQKSYGHQMNLGLDAAQGTYIGILETDDFIHKDMYKKLWELSQGGTVDIVKGNFWDFHDYGEEKNAIKNQEKAGLPEKEIFTAKSNPVILKGHPSVWSAIYRKDFLTGCNIRFMEIPGAGWVDNPFYFETICRAESILWTEEPFYYYRKTNPDSSSNNLKDLTLPLRRMLDNMDVFDRYGSQDEETLAIVYERAMMYLNGITLSPDYTLQQEKIAPYKEELRKRIDPQIALKHLKPEYKILYMDELSPLRKSLKRGEGTVSFTPEELCAIQEENNYLKSYYRENCVNRPKYDDFALRVGRKVTWLPRKIMGGIDCLRSHGMHYTVRRFGEHIKEAFKR